MPVDDKSLARIRGLDGLRALAAGMVFTYHAWGWRGRPVSQGAFGEPLYHLFEFGAQGVPLFFVLSGFLLSLPFWRAVLGGVQVDLWSYFKRRFFRIYPAYVAALILYVVFQPANMAWGDRAMFAAMHMGLVHNLWEASVYSLSPPLWSVAAEFQLYLLLPGVFWGLGKFIPGAGKEMAAFWVFILSGLAALPLVVGLGFPVLLPPDGFLQGALGVLRASALTGLASFGAGIAAARIYLLWMGKPGIGGQILPGMSNAPGKGVVILLQAIAVAGLVLYASFYQTGELGFWFNRWPTLPLLMAVLVLAVALEPGSWLSRLLDWRPLRFLGAISYSFYLVHDFGLALTFRLLPRFVTIPEWGLSWLAYSVTVFGAWLLYRVVESPLRYGLLRPGALLRVIWGDTHSR